MREAIFSGDGFEVALLQSEVIPPGFHHGFTTRAGGVSVGPCAGLNLGGRWGDDPSHVAENRRRLSVAAGGAPHFATQVHGRAVAAVGATDARAATARIEADALITDAPGTGVGVYVADCVPVVIADPRTCACAAVHAGWRGTVAGVLAEALARLMAGGARPAELRVTIGPSIGPCCFEVGPEVVAAVEAADAGARAAGAIRVPADRAAREHVDLWTLNQRQALALGVPASAVDVAGLCTSCDPARFYSYRRDRGRTGQMAAFIARAPAAP